MATRPSKTETKQKTAARHRRLRKGDEGRAIVPRAGTVGGGRAIGQTNRLSRQAKENLEQAFEDLGGVTALVKWGRANKSDFYKIWARLIPKDVSVNPGQGLEDMLMQLQQSRLPSGEAAPVVDGEYDLVNETPRGDDA